MVSENEQFELIINNILADGYGICDNFFTEIEVENLIQSYKNRFKTGVFKPAKIGEKIEEKIELEIRGDQIFWMEQNEINSAEKVFFAKIKSFIQYLNMTCYLGIKNEEFHYAKYGNGKFYRRHRDSFQLKKNRIFSVILYLNKGWVVADGGNLVIYLQKNGLENPIEINPIAGRLVCFESEKLDHEVMETFTDRLSITGWLLNN